MPALQQHWIATAYLSPTTGPVAIGDCLVLDAAGQWHVVATVAARTAAGRLSRVSGIALNAGDINNRRVEIQCVGPCPPSVTGLGAGVEATVYLSTTGRLVRAGAGTATSVAVGSCDADGWTHLNFPGGGGSGLALPLLLDTDNATDHIKFGADPVGGSFPTYGALRTPVLLGNGDNTDAANYQTLVATRIGADTIPAIGVYAYASGAKDLVFGGRWDWTTGSPKFDSAAFWFPVIHFNGGDWRYYAAFGDSQPSGRNQILRQVSVGTGAQTPLGAGLGAFLVTHIDATVVARTATEGAVFKFSAFFEGGAVVLASDLNPYFTRKSAGASAWTVVLDANGQVVFSGANAVTITAYIENKH